MAESISSRVLAHQREKLIVKVIGGTAVNYDIPHNFGVIPISVQVSPIGDGVTAVEISRDASKVTVKISSGGAAEVTIWNGGA